MSKSNSKLKELLGILDELDDKDVLGTTLTGLACGRTSRELHIAVDSGVVAVPISEIDDVTEVSIGNPTHVSVRVKQSDAIRFIRRPPSLATAKGGSSLGGATALRSALSVLRSSDDIKWPPIRGPGVNTSMCVTTVTDGNACDDFECEDFPDDLGQ